MEAEIEAVTDTLNHLDEYTGRADFCSRLEFIIQQLHRAEDGLGPKPQSMRRFYQWWCDESARTADEMQCLESSLRRPTITPVSPENVSDIKRLTIRALGALAVCFILVLAGREEDRKQRIQA